MKFLKHLQLHLLGSILLLFCRFTVFSQEYWQPVAESFGQNVQCFYTDPETNFLYIGGSFNRINGELRTGIATYDGSNFYPLGCGVEWDCINSIGTYQYIRPVLSITKYKNEIYAGGAFNFIDSINTVGIAKWNGNRWNACNTDTLVVIKDMLVFNDELYVVGMFTNIGNVTAQSVAKWDGTQWYDVGNFYNYHSDANNIFSIAEYHGEIYVGGIFQDSLGVPVNIKRFDGTNWYPVGGGTKGQQSIVYDICVYHDELYVGGFFTKANGNTGDFIQKWNGQYWSEVGGGVWDTYGYPVPVRKFYVFNDELYLIGDFDHVGNIPAQWMAKWDGTKWCSFPTTLFHVPPLAISSYNDQIIIGGSWFFTETDTIYGVAKWTGGNYVDTCSTLGINEIIPEKEVIQIFPNPATNTITINMSNKRLQFVTTEIEYKIINKLGQQVKTGTIKEFPYTVTIEDLKEGLYVLILQNERFNETRKFVKLKE